MLLYWSGAALALMADAEIRSESSGARSLDTVLASFARCCLPSTRSWEPEALFQALDQHGGNGVFMRLYTTHADRPGMPDTLDVLTRLGVLGAGDGVTLDGDAPWAEIRRAIMTGRQ